MYVMVLPYGLPTTHADAPALDAPPVSVAAICITGLPVNQSVVPVASDDLANVAIVVRVASELVATHPDNVTVASVEAAVTWNPKSDTGRSSTTRVPMAVEVVAVSIRALNPLPS